MLNDNIFHCALSWEPAAICNTANTNRDDIDNNDERNVFVSHVTTLKNSHNSVPAAATAAADDDSNACTDAPQ